MREDRGKLGVGWGWGETWMKVRRGDQGMSGGGERHGNRGIRGWGERKTCGSMISYEDSSMRFGSELTSFWGRSFRGCNSRSAPNVVGDWVGSFISTASPATSRNANVPAPRNAVLFVRFLIKRSK